MEAVAANSTDSSTDSSTAGPTWEAEAQSRDTSDALAPFRDHFYRQPGVIYLDGNSLGLLSREAEAALLRALDMWKTLAIDGWTSGPSPWFWMAEELAKRVAPLVGAGAGQVIVTNSTTVNLHQLVATLYTPGPCRPKILADALNFPSDLYALQSQLRLRGLEPDADLVLVPARPGMRLEEEDIVAHMTPDVQMAVLPAVVYTSGQLLDIAYLTEQAHRRGILMGFDCSHSIGAIPHRFDAQGVDFAFWCSYKYLNGGPGAAGGLYLNRRHFGRAPGLAGWFSSAKERQFDMTLALDAAPGAGALQIGTPNILSMAPLQGALELFAQAGMENLRRKSLALTAFLMALVDRELEAYGVTILNPREDDRRGGHVAMQHPEALRIGKALRARGVVPDFRPPNILRFAPVPLYTSFADCGQAVQILKSILLTGAYAEYPQGRDMVP
jgi:kynureninase